MTAGAGGAESLQPIMADSDVMAFAMKGVDDMGGSLLVVFNQQYLHRHSGGVPDRNSDANDTRMFRSAAVPAAAGNAGAPTLPDGTRRLNL